VTRPKLSTNLQPTLDEIRDLRVISTLHNTIYAPAYWLFVLGLFATGSAIVFYGLVPSLLRNRGTKCPPFTVTPLVFPAVFQLHARQSECPINALLPGPIAGGKRIYRLYSHLCAWPAC
jgi:hypothetical protein